jgi:hypothetical protein
MQIFIKIKQAGKRRLVLEKQAIEIADLGHQPTLKDLIVAVVTQQVAAYNAQTLEKPLVHFLTETQIQDAAATGKVGFGALYNDNKADLEKAIQVALEAHIDGLFAVAVEDKVVAKLDDLLNLKADSVVSFIRLTLLIGH